MKPTWRSLNRRIVSCDRCERLIDHCQLIAQKRRRAFHDWKYWGKPVPNMGTGPAPLLILGLAPAAHGANRTGRMFTGDRSGDWLFRAMHRFGFANQAQSTSIDDGLALVNSVITAVCHCAPPANRPTPEEIGNCRSHLLETMKLCNPRVIVALGKIAWDQFIRFAVEQSWIERRKKRPPFAHAQQVKLDDGRYLIGSYHPSQQNTFTGKLTEPMLDDVFRKARRLIGDTC